MISKAVLVDDWKQCLKWIETWVVGAGMFAEGVIVFVPSIQEVIPKGIYPLINMGFFALIFIGRIVRQPALEQQRAGDKNGT